MKRYARKAKHLWSVIHNQWKAFTEIFQDFRQIQWLLYVCVSVLLGSFYMYTVYYIY